MAGKTPEHRISIRVGDRIFAGHTENGLSIKPNFEPVLLKQIGGKNVEQFVDSDVEFNVVGLTYKRTPEEAGIYHDYTDLRMMAAIGGEVEFLYGDLASLNDLASGIAKVIEFNETTGSSKNAGNWNCKLRAVKGTVMFGLQDYDDGAKIRDAVVDDENFNEITLTFSDQLDDTSVPDVSAFAVSGRTISGLVISGDTVTLTVNESFNSREEATVTYIKPVINTLKDTDGNEVRNFLRNVTNNVTWSILSSAISTASQTVSLYRLDVLPGRTISIDWGDGSVNDYTSSANGSAKTHTYGSAGNWVIRISSALDVIEIYLTDIRLRFNSSSLRWFGDNLASVSLQSLFSPVINSEDMAHLKLSEKLQLSGNRAGTYNINSNHFVSYTLSKILQLNFSVNGTYNINSSHFVGYSLNDLLGLNFTWNGTYNINSIHFAAYPLASWLSLGFSTPGTYNINTSHFANVTVNQKYILNFPITGTYNVERADFVRQTRINSVTIRLGTLPSSDVDKILLGFYDALPSRTAIVGTIDLTGNSAPTGIYRSMIPPVTGKEAAYALLDENSVYHYWGTINVQGGL